MNNTTVGLFMLFVLLLALINAVFPDDSAKHDAVRYCQIVHDHRWPDFHHVYRQQCNKDGTLNEDWFYGR